MLLCLDRIHQSDTRSWQLIGENLVRTLINLENTNRLLDLFRRNEYRFMFLNTRCYDILFNKLYEEQRYQDVVNLFEESIAFYRRSAKSASSRIPTRHLEMVTSSLIKLVSCHSSPIFHSLCFCYEVFIYFFTLSEKELGQGSRYGQTNRSKNLFEPVQVLKSFSRSIVHACV